MPEKIVSLILAAVILAVLLCGCYDAREIDDEVYAICVGVDKGQTSKVRLTIQYPTYKSGGGGGEESSKKEVTGAGSKNMQSGSNVHTVEAPTMLEAVDMYSTAISRRVSLVHAKWLIFSEEYAKDGIEGYIAGLERYRETRASMAVLIVRGTAENFILENQTSIGESISKSAELHLAQSAYTGIFPKVSFLDFYFSLFSSYRSPVALYGGVNEFNTKDAETSGTGRTISREGLLPGNVPRVGVAKRELAGLAVFNGGKMVGQLDAYETSSYMMIIGEYNGGKISIPDKYSPKDSIVFDVHKSREPGIKGYFRNGRPVIDLDIKLEGEVYAIQSRVDYEKLALSGDLEQQIEEYLLKGINQTIKKTQKEFKADIFGFGEHMADNFFTIQEWEAYNWLSHFEEATFNTSIDFKVRRTGLINHSSPIFTNKGIGG